MSSVHREQFLCLCLCGRTVQAPALGTAAAPTTLSHSWALLLLLAIQDLTRGTSKAEVCRDLGCSKELCVRIGASPLLAPLQWRKSLLLNSRPSLSRNIHLFLRERWHLGCPGHPAELQSEAPAGPGCSPGAPHALSVGKGLVECEPQLWACARA